MNIGTKLLHIGNEVDKMTGAVVPPVHYASTYKQTKATDIGPYEYSRGQNPTREILEESIASLENGSHGFAFSSGMAAISSVFMLFAPGDHIVACADIYGGAYRALTGLFNRFDIEVTFVDTTDLSNIEKAIQNNTKAVYLETPSNPLLKITDLKGAAQIARDNNLLSIIDNTFMSPLLQRPVDLGIDIVVHSATKFLAGHSDVLAGLAVVNDEKLAKRLKFVQTSFGAVLGPQDCWLTLRGIKTLKARMKEQEESAIKIAEWLSEDSRVAEVFYPGLPSHPGREIHLEQADGFGAVLGFKVKNKNKALKVMENVKIPVLAVSLGAVESIISYPTTMSHGSVPDDVRKGLGIEDNLIRLSVGLEDVNDLIEDLDENLE
ncbi:trans-sulfuration enzyme family protein [Natranaerofaba carboxydovora]|uniref:trans-sulfuration enzyme family protein n=1 Tax=Natranaerofaba carboxydovora TaxID=2742683 RepID=UPI001F1363AE|nr:PLP-dependent aspartate aminotransferase family protein [Natranaerofaba carboxydovora]UMZ74477.1 Cystathionine beta-lyase MetC [Natranaerofaba carboxydovora]